MCRLTDVSSLEGSTFGIGRKINDEPPRIRVYVRNAAVMIRFITSPLGCAFVTLPDNEDWEVEHYTQLEQQRIARSGSRRGVGQLCEQCLDAANRL